ncbi:MAG: HEAT repeat domain-containing protein [Pirellulales bacterium]|nr:HEAT repeat domain-containing protein [Pirellulales bacterium]
MTHCAANRGGLLGTALALGCLAGLGWIVPAPRAAACPFCIAISKTLSEEIAGSDHVVFARRLAGTDVPVGAAANSAEPASPGQPSSGAAQQVQHTAQFEIVEVLKSRGGAQPGQQIELLYFGRHDEDVLFAVYGMGEEQISWSTPVALTPKSIAYLKQLPRLPPAGADRLAFFQQYFEDEEAMLAADAYDEFARAPYADVRALKDRMDRQQLLAWIRSPEVSVSRRRLYLTMLGVCGLPEDADALEQLIRSDDRQVRSCLDALVAAYLNLKGEPGLPLVEELFLGNPEAEYTDTYSTIMALRFHLQESEQIPKQRLLGALRRVLDRKDLADLVIPDLARWQDWSVVDRLVALFKEADQKSAWVRVPVVNYLRACPLPEAKERLEELAQIDPDAVRRAQQFFPLGGQQPAQPGGTSAGTAALSTDGQSTSAAENTAANAPSASPAAEGEAASASAADALPDTASATATHSGNDANTGGNTEQTADATGGAASSSQTPPEQTVQPPGQASAQAESSAAGAGTGSDTAGQPKPTWFVLGTAVAVGLVLTLLFVAILSGNWGRSS